MFGEPAFPERLTPDARHPHVVGRRTRDGGQGEFLESTIRDGHALPATPCSVESEWLTVPGGGAVTDRPDLVREGDHAHKPAAPMERQMSLSPPPSVPVDGVGVPAGSALGPLLADGPDVVSVPRVDRLDSRDTARPDGDGHLRPGFVPVKDVRAT